MTYLLVWAGCDWLSHKIIDSVHGVCWPKSVVLGRPFCCLDQGRVNGLIACRLLRITRGHTPGRWLVLARHRSQHIVGLHFGHIAGRSSAVGEVWMTHSRGLYVCSVVFLSSGFLNKKTAGTPKCAGRLMDRVTNYPRITSFTGLTALESSPLLPGYPSRPIIRKDFLSPEHGDRFVSVGQFRCSGRLTRSNP